MPYRSSVPVPQTPIAQGAPQGSIAPGIERVSQALRGLTDHLVEGRARREMLAARTRAATKIFELEDRFSTDDGFADIGERFSTEARQAYDEIATTFTIGAARDQFEEDFADMALQAGFRVRRQATQREGDQAIAALDASLDTQSEAFATGRIPLAEARRIAAEDIARAEEAGWITAEAAGRRTRAFESSILDADALKAIERNPAAVNLEANGPYGALGDLRRLELKSRRDSRIAQAQAEQRARLAQIEARARLEFNDLKDIMAAGFTPDADRLDSVGRLVSASGDASLIGDFRNAVIDSATAATAATLPPAAFAAELAAARQRASSDPDAARRVTTLERVAAAQRTGLKENAIGYAAKAAGVVVAPIDETAAPEALRQRASVANATRAQFGVTNFFQPEEKARLTQWLETANGDAMLDFAARLKAGAGSDARRALGDLGDSAPAFSRLGELALAQGTHSTARDGFSGLVVLRDNPDILPRKDNAARGEAIADTLTGLLPETSSAIEGQIIAAADAIYAARAKRAGADGFDDALYRNSLLDALGRSPAGGGVGKVNGQRILLPPDADATLIDRTLSKLDNDGWTALSATGGRPVYTGNKAAAASDLRRAQLVSVAPGYYQVRTPGGTYLIDDKTGDRFVVALDRARLQSVGAESVKRTRASTRAALVEALASARSLDEREVIGARLRKLDEEEAGPKPSPAVDERIILPGKL